MESEFVVKNPADFKLVIESIFSWYKNKEEKKSLVIALSGDLGAGKTTFTQELGKYLGVTEHITSPTFTIMKQYELSNDCFDQLFHIDAYRIENEEEVGPLRLESFLNGSRSVICLEWPEQIPSIIPQSALRVMISIAENDERLVKIIFGD
ncbi:tRNA (adenosine(37)-N6)-threonylcarbamoyltransferase complex ATPase subunit type 1 TsaE [Candidatus Kaiserbacteria bacterium]|nr:tRNA (adenosine(37)-N6)-threonylcarbamoyltransferase complex ATPase subunit type 1 TsaE [Candidatus Kaiserbacteria bacterium]